MADETKYTRPVCRGSLALGSACGRCERCERTKSQLQELRPALRLADDDELFKPTPKPTSDLPLYRAEGLHVMCRSVINPKGGMSMGFRVCTVNEYVDGGAEEIARALNACAVPADGPAPVVAFPDTATVTRLRDAISVAVKNLSQGILAEIGVVKHVVRSLEDVLNG